ncbi:MAG: hypothetical protein LIR47_12180 [Spirochaetota bacterium]|nr:hypothetical protein [Spirochaetota bacterium]
MKKQRILLLLVVLGIGMLKLGAQESLVYRQTFDTNKMYWPVDDNFSIIGGEYVLYKENQELYAYLDLPSKDGSFQIDTRFVDGKDTAGYGLLFRLQDPYNFYFFFLVDQGYFLAGKAVDRQGINFCPWTYTSIIKAQAKNTLKVTYQGQKLTFLINNTEVFSHQDSSFESGGIGLYTQGGVRVGFDDILVWETTASTQ